MGGTPIPNGASFTYVGNWPAAPFKFLNPVGASIADVGTDLLDAGLQVTASSFSGLLADVGLPSGFQAKLTVVNRSGINMDTEDATDAIRDSVHTVFGAYPASDAIESISVTSGGSTQTVPTGQTGNKGAGNPAAKQCGDPSWGFFDDPQQWFSCLTTKGLSTLGIVFIGLGLGVILVVTAEKKIL